MIVNIHLQEMPCPICKSMMKSKQTFVANEYEIRCKNDCFHYQVYPTLIGSVGGPIEMGLMFSTYIFDDDFSFTSANEQKELFEKKIEEKINYWKENDRYLAMIMTKGDDVIG